MSSIDMNDLSWIRLSFVDVFGTAHSMQIPMSRWAAAAENGVLFDGSSLEGRARLMETDMRAHALLQGLAAPGETAHSGKHP